MLLDAISLQTNQQMLLTNSQDHQDLSSEKGINSKNDMVAAKKFKGVKCSSN